MSRYLTTQERVDLAVKAGHRALVEDYIRMHNNGDGVKSELEKLSIADRSGELVTYDQLPSYGIAAVDSYLNIYDIPMVTNEPPAPDGEKRRPTMAQLAKYAKNAAEDAAVYRGSKRTLYRPDVLIDRLTDQLEYEAIDTNFQILVACASARSVGHCGLKLVQDADTGTKTLTLSTGAEIEMHLDTEQAEGLQRVYVLNKEAPASGDFELQRGYLSVSVKLISELEEEVDRQLKL